MRRLLHSLRIQSGALKRRSVGVVAFSVILGTSTGLALTRASSASAEWSHGSSTCSSASKEDPANLYFPNLRGVQTSDKGKTWHTTTRAHLGSDVARAFWNYGFGSSASYFSFPSTNGGCRNQTLYATNSEASGWHVRFWQGTTDPYVWGAAHHDFYCIYQGKHSSDDYNLASSKVANNFVDWNDGYVSGLLGPNFYWTRRQDRVPSTFMKCGQWIYDDGKTYVVSEYSPDYIYVNDRGLCATGSPCEQP